MKLFRLGRYRAKGVDRAHNNKAPYAGCTSSDSSDDEPGGIAGLSRPTRCRAQAALGSLPTPRLGIAQGAADWRARGRHVSFSRVTIREYSTILGDHPCCPSGPPLSLGWTLEREDSLGLEDYEGRRGLPGPAVRLSGAARRNMLAGPLTPEGKPDDRRAAPAYSRAELWRAERRLARERAGCNARLHRKATDRFFSRPLSPEAGAALVVVAAMEGLDGELGVSAVKPLPNEEEEQEEQASSD